MEDKRIHRNKVDYGIRDYRKFYEQKYNNNQSFKNYNKIITEYNKALTKLIINDGLSYTIPYLLLEIIIMKDRRKIRLKDGKVYNPNPIDFKATKELWEKDKEAKDKKLKVRHNNYNTSGYVFRIYCKKFKSKIKGRSYFRFKPNRVFQRNLAKRIKDPNKEPFDSFLLYNPI